MTIKIKGIDFKTAKHAVMNFHYSKKMPIGKLIKYGVWENDKFIGAVVYGRGSSPFLGTAYNLNQTEVCELVRVALSEHSAPVSQIVSETLRHLRKENFKMKLVVSFADARQKHYGIIYQAMNWIYTGKTTENKEYFYKGKWYHSRMIGNGGFISETVLSKLSEEDKDNLLIRKIEGKFRYLYPLDKKLGRELIKLALPYPHAVEGLEESRNNSIDQVQVRYLPTAPKRVLNG